jgi:hypothetical protein
MFRRKLRLKNWTPGRLVRRGARVDLRVEDDALRARLQVGLAWNSQIMKSSPLGKIC